MSLESLDMDNLQEQIQSPTKLLHNLQKIFMYVVLFLFPLIFFPLTRDFLVYSKYYFIVFTMFLALGGSAVLFVISKKIRWVHNPATQSLLLILLAYILSIVLMSPNKFQALYNPQYGLIMIIAMIVMYLFASHVFEKAATPPALVISVSGLLVAVFGLIIMVDPFQSVALPSYWSFLSSTTFNTIGSSMHFIAFLIFILVGSSLYMWRTHNTRRTQDNDPKVVMILLGSIITFTLIALIFYIFTIAQQIMNEGAQIILPPLVMSWHAAVEVLKNPMTGVFGVGVDNFAALFTQVRTSSYNASELWQINSFNTSRSAILHILTEVGVLGLTGYVLLISLFIKQIKHVKLEHAGYFITSVLILIVLPPSIISFFLFFISAALMAADLRGKKHHDEYVIDFSSSQLVPIFIGIIVIFSLVYGGSVYFLGRNFMSEFYFKRSLDGISANSLQQLYDNQVRALQYDNTNEEFHRQFAQTNLLLANNIAAIPAEELTDQDRQTITQAIQASIDQAKIAASLNPAKVANWEILAGIYRQIINVAENAPTWTVATYQQAIALDPRNPVLRQDLGGVFYLFQNYDSAQQLFEQAVSLKSDWPNARYNLAWTYYQKELYGPAFDQMQIVISLLDPATQEADFKQAQADLETFRAAFEEQQVALQQQIQEQQEQLQQQQSQELNLPTPPPAQLEKKIELNEEQASPGAQLNQ
jgi:hypothetical protein